MAVPRLIPRLIPLPFSQFFLRSLICNRKVRSFPRPRSKPCFEIYVFSKFRFTYLKSTSSQFATFEIRKSTFFSRPGYFLTLDPTMFSDVHRIFGTLVTMSGLKSKYSLLIIRIGSENVTRKFSDFHPDRPRTGYHSCRCQRTRNFNFTTCEVAGPQAIV